MLTFLVFIPICSSISGIWSPRNTPSRTDPSERANGSVPHTLMDLWYQCPHGPAGDQGAAGATHSVDRAHRCTFLLMPPLVLALLLGVPGGHKWIAAGFGAWRAKSSCGSCCSLLLQNIQAVTTCAGFPKLRYNQSRCHVSFCSWSWCYLYRLTSFLPQIFPLIITRTLFV